MIEPGSRRSVNWMTGMLLSPEHFRDQDRYIRESVSWLIRHCIPGAGLVGGGVHMPPGQYGMERHDPKFDVVDEGSVVKIHVREARGVTASGAVVDVGGGSPISCEVSKESLEGVASPIVYVVATGQRVDDPRSVGEDPANPNQAAYVEPEAVVSLGISAERGADALAVGRISRAAATLNFEIDGTFIPPCVTVIAHSQLYGGYRRIQESIRSLANRFTALHRLIAAWISGARLRNVDVRPDMDRLLFVGRAVEALDDCAYALLDAVVTPETVFQQIDRVGRRLALALDLSASMQSFLQGLSETDHSYEDLLQEERDVLAADRRTRTGADLSVPLTRATRTIERIGHLIDALEGKYTDYRVNRRVDALKFLVDRDGEGFYEALSARPRMQTQADILTLTYSQLSLNAQMAYRLVLVGDAGSEIIHEIGDVVDVTVHFNMERGGAEPVSKSRVREMSDHHNIGVDFDAPTELGTITDLKVIVRGGRFRTAVIYRRVRGVVPDPAPPTIDDSSPPESPGDPGGGGIIINTPW